VIKSLNPEFEQEFASRSREKRDFRNATMKGAPVSQQGRRSRGGGRTADAVEEEEDAA